MLYMLYTLPTLYRRHYMEHTRAPTSWLHIRGKLKEKLGRLTFNESLYAQGMKEQQANATARVKPEAVKGVEQHTGSENDIDYHVFQFAKQELEIENSPEIYSHTHDV
jgi:uncharacterized protein YjbJ (UPF0337 family)